jgi:beta-lactamase regulating signal transducer with metallopeptidase domain
MSGFGTVGSLFDLCRTILQGGLGVALQSTLLLGLGLLAGCLLRGRGPSLAAFIYRVTLIGTLSGALFSLLLGPHLQPPWSVSLPTVKPHPIRRAALDGWPDPRITGDPQSASAPLIDPTRLPAIPPPGSPFSRPGSDTLRSRSHEESGTDASAAREPVRAVLGRSGAPDLHLMGWLYVTVVSVWATGVMLLLVRLLFCWLLLDGLRRRAVPLHSEAAQGLLADLCRTLQVRPPLLLADTGIHSPFLTGLRHPAILLPADCARQFDGPTLRLILAHELIHLARRDCAWTLAARLACALGWTQPLLWALCSRLEQASEEVCDQEVIRLEGNPRAYARCLFTLSELLMPAAPARALGVGVVTIRSSLGQRIQRILDGARQHSLPPSNRLRAAISLIAVVVVALGLFLAAAVAAPSGERSVASKHVLSDVRELDKRVTFTETKIPLGELVQRIAADTGARLTAVPEVADEPVAVVVREIPARELLEQLADLLDYTWSRRGKGEQMRCEIWQDLASKQREEALRNSLRADVIRRFQEELQRNVEMASWSPERLQQIHDGRPTHADDPDANERARRFQISWTMMSPISRAVGQLLGRLSPEQWATVRDGKTLTFSTDPHQDELAMPTETERALRSAKPTLYPPGEPIGYHDPNGPEQTRHVDEGLQQQWAAATGYRVTVQISPDNWRNLNMLQLTAAAKPFRTGAPPRSEFFDAYAGTSVQIRTEPSDPMSWERDQSMPPDAELAKDPVFGARQLFKPEVKPRHDWVEDPGTPAMFRLRDLLPDLARTYKVGFIADAYTPVNGRLGPGAFSGPESLAQFLSSIASMTHRWDHRGNLVRLRSRTWFLDRPKEIPLRLVRHWKELIDRHGALPLEAYIEMTRSLTDLQLENLSHIGEDVELPPSTRWYEIGRSRYGLRLYDALLPDQQQALWRGKSLPAAQMTATQQQLFLASLAERGRYEPYPMNLERLSDGRLSLTAEPRTLTVDRHAAATLSDVRAGGSGQPRPEAKTAPTGVTRYPVTHLDFHFWYAPDQEDTITLTVAAAQ